MTTENRQPSGAPTTLNRDRLSKVLALTASPVDGEALAATRAMVRMLSEVGMRPEDLVGGAPVYPCGNAAARPAPPAYPPGSPQSYRPWQTKPPSIRDLLPSEARQVLASLLAGALSDDDRAFVASIAERMRTAPHRQLTTGEVRRLNRLWRGQA